MLVVAVLMHRSGTKDHCGGVVVKDVSFQCPVFAVTFRQNTGMPGTSTIPANGTTQSIQMIAALAGGWGMPNNQTPKANGRGKRLGGKGGDVSGGKYSANTFGAGAKQKKNANLAFPPKHDTDRGEAAWARTLHEEDASVAKPKRTASAAAAKRQQEAKAARLAAERRRTKLDGRLAAKNGERIELCDSDDDT